MKWKYPKPKIDWEKFKEIKLTPIEVKPIKKWELILLILTLLSLSTLKYFN